MSRPLRIEFEGAVYHVTARGDRQEPIFVDDLDRRRLLGVVERAMERFDARMLAYCLMGNHYHFVLCTNEPNLSRLMRQINGVYTQDFNRRHGKVGHLFQGRFKAVLVDRDAYLLEACRYVELNPVRAGLVARPEAWAWSSARAHLGQAPMPPWLDGARLQGQLLGREPRHAADRRRAAARYAELLAAGQGVPLWDRALRQQIYLGDEAFVERMQAQVQPARRTTADVPAAQRRAGRELEHYLREAPTRDEAIRRAHAEGGLTMTRIAAGLGLSVSRVSRLIARAEGAAAGPEAAATAETVETADTVARRARQAKGKT